MCPKFSLKSLSFFTLNNITLAITNNSNTKVNDRFHPIAFLRNMNIFTMKPINKKIKKEFGIQKF